MVGHGPPVALVCRVQFSLGEGSGKAFRSNIARAEPGTFLGAHGDYLDRSGKNNARLHCPEHTVEPCQNAGQTIEISALRHTVYVRTDQNICLCFAVFGQAENTVLACVGFDAQAGLRSNSGKKIQNLGLFFREGRAADPCHIAAHRGYGVEDRSHPVPQTRIVTSGRR